MRPATRLVLLAMLAVAACGGPAPSATPPAPLVTPSLVPPSSTPAPTLGPQTAPPRTELDALVARMAAAVVARDRAGYLALVDLSNPAFALEHSRWADGWSGPNPVRSYALQLQDVVLQGTVAAGRLTVTWMLATDAQLRTATFDVWFTPGSNGWRYAGERWITTEVPHFRIQVALGLEDLEPGVAAELPAVYDGVTEALGYVAAAPLEIKLYADGPALVANTLLSLPVIRGWNEPGEALKLVANRNAPSVAQVVAHEFTHFSLFDQAGTNRTRMPWWLDEGTATYVAEPFERNDPRDRLGQVIAWEAAGELASWDSIAVFEDAPVELWEFVYPQGYAMVRYITETYGETKRNAWLAVMATAMTIDQATPAVLGRSFGELDADFRAWLSAGT